VLSKELQWEETTGHPLNSRKKITKTVWFHLTLYYQTGCHIQTRGSSWHINLSINLHQPTKFGFVLSPYICYVYSPVAYFSYRIHRQSKEALPLERL
jgi:hypothetical protein